MIANFRNCLSAMLLAPLSMACLADDGLEGLCEDFELALEADIAELGNLRIHRGPFDFEGARLVGCIRNTRAEVLEGAGLIYDQIQSRGGGGGTTSLNFPALQSGEVGRFVSHPFREDSERLEDWGITGIELRALQMRAGMKFVDHDFTERIELEYPIRELPDSELRRACVGLTAEGGEVTLSQLRVVETSHGELKVAGCILNGGDGTLADDHRNSVPIEYSGEPGDDYDGIMHWGGSGQLNVAAPLEPGSTGMFVGDFEVEERIARVVIRLTERVDHDGWYQNEPVGPEYAIER